MAKSRNRLGINTTKSHICFALLTPESGRTKTLKAQRLAITNTRPTTLVSQVRGIFDSLKGEFGEFGVAICECSGGPRGSSVEAIKAEALVELTCDQEGLATERFHPNGFRNTVGCGKGQKWQDRAKEIFNDDGKIAYFSAGIDGAIVAAFRAMGLRHSSEV